MKLKDGKKEPFGNLTGLHRRALHLLPEMNCYNNIKVL